MAFDCSGLRSCCCSCQLPDQTKRPRYERRAASPDADSPGDQPELHRDLWAEWAAIAGTTARLAVHGVPILPLSLFPVPQCESQFGSLLCMVMAASNSFRTAASIQAAEAAPFWLITRRDFSHTLNKGTVPEITSKIGRSLDFLRLSPS